MLKRFFLTLVFIFTALFSSAYIRPDAYNIDVAQNAISHNNIGLNALQDGRYFEAIQEFYLAISLNPNTQATSVYYSNLGDAYLKLGYYAEAQKCYEKAIVQYNLNFAYYQKLVQSYKAQKIVSQKIIAYKKRAEKNPLDMIVLGLLYVENGNKRGGIIKLDEFCMQEPSLLITGAVRNYINELTAD